MLSTAEIQSYLTRVSYKPGWVFSYYEGRWEGPHLRIYCAEVPDSFTPGETTVLDIHCFLSPNDIADTTALNRYLMYRLGRIEMHEMREFFKVNGKVVSSPHMPHADRDTEEFGVWSAPKAIPQVDASAA